MIEISVMMPMFRSQYIGWLPLEGLIRQKQVPCGWELIIAEEVNEKEVYGWNRIKKYQSKLKKAGCKRIKYIPIEEWIPLGCKLHLMVQHVSDTSRIYAQNSSDYYSAPTRLAAHYKALSDPEVIHHLPTRAVHFIIKTRQAVMQNTDYAKRKDHVVGRATRMDIMRSLPAGGPRSSVDGWVFRHIRKTCQKMGIPLKILFDRTDRWNHALSTFGFNNISPLTGPQMTKSATSSSYLRAYPLRTLQVPPEILKKLYALNQHLNKHNHLGKR